MRLALNLVLALLVTVVLASAAAFFVGVALALFDALPPPPIWLVIGSPVMVVGVLLYNGMRRAGRKRGAAAGLARRR